ncbi:MAG: hypothetical protein II704_00530 [Erysipelotrichaceae bacterium]|nr:hypothetical protein [Erysipelotrichaceae bacterium]
MSYAWQTLLSGGGYDSILTDLPGTCAIFTKTFGEIRFLWYTLLAIGLLSKEQYLSEKRVSFLAGIFLEKGGQHLEDPADHQQQHRYL